MARTRHTSSALIESLEGRQLFSVTVPGASAVEGSYVGEALYSGVTREIKLKIAAKSETLTVAHEGSAAMHLTTAELQAFVAGNFSFVGGIKGVKLDLTGAFSNADSTITGSFTGRGKLTLDGTFTLSKV